MNATSPAARLAQALDPASCLVDARDSRDRLAFVAELSRLILYYDAQNRLAGDWQPFFLKDPAILLAAIGKTDYKSSHIQFVQLDQRASSSNGVDATVVNELCQLLRGLFVTLDRWLHFMQRGGRDYPLYAFLKKKIETSLSTQLWTMVACQQYLSAVTARSPHGQVDQPDTATYQGFEQAWRTSVAPGWPPLETKDSFVDEAAAQRAKAEPLAEGWKALSGIYLTVFDVFVQAVEQAPAQFYAQVGNQTRFPDTALLIAFCALMDTQRGLLNDYGRQHLDFYYGRVLQQEPLPAQPDEAFVFLSLKAGSAPLALAEGAEFTAGTYPDNSDIVFATDGAVEINAVTVAAACTLYYQPQAPAGLYRSDIATPAQQPWRAFGDGGGVPVQQGFVLASPMLLLQGGTRHITISLEYAAAPTGNLFEGATCYLSTGKAWLAVPIPPGKPLTPTSIQLDLDPGRPPIVAFAAPQDGMASPWPMFKLLLGPDANLLEPPALRKVRIDVTVNGLAQVSLANDVSPLPDNAAASMFGPVPELGNCFYVGSGEAFAKPLQTLGVTVHWDNLPAYFSDYYADYNTYLATSPTPAPVPPLQTFDNTAFRGQWGLLTGQGWEAREPADPLAAAGSPLAPTCLFQQPTPAPAKAPDATVEPTAAPEAVVVTGATAVPTATKRGAPTAAPTAVPTAAPSETPVTVREPNLAQSTFTFTPTKDGPFAAVPDLARSPLPPPLQAHAGYLRFALLAPAWAFGHELYPKLVSHITLQNAQTLIGMAKEPSLIAKIWAAIAALLGWIGAGIKKVGQTLVDALKKLGQTLAYALKTIAGSVLDALKKLPEALASPFKKAWGWIGKLFGKHDADPATPASTSPPTPAPTQAAPSQPSLAPGPIMSPLPPSKPALLEMPNLPYSPRQTGVSLDYTASSTAVIPPATTGDDGQPLQLFHLGSFQPYLAFESGVAGGQGFAACVPGVAAGGLPLFPGAGSQGVLYLALSGVTAACTLSLYLEVCSAGGTGNVLGWFCWTANGWQAVTVLDDGTGGLRRSGIVRLALPAPLACAVMPDKHYWLALASGRTAPGSMFGYVQTQAVRVRRADAGMCAPGQAPGIAANAITAMRNQPPTIAEILQPFASAGGAPAETQDSFGGPASFYRRVAARLNHKDRCSSLRNYADMAHDACPGLYFARAVADAEGQVTIGLVKRYANAGVPNAWRPVMSADELDAVQQHLAQRVSAMALPCAAGFDYEEVTVKATLVVDPNANSTTLLAELGQWLMLYLSPWIDSDLPQMDLAQGLTGSGVIGVLRSHPQVRSIAAFDLLGAGGAPLKPGPGGLYTPAPDALFVTALQHALTLTSSGPTPPPSSPPLAHDEAGQATDAEVAA